MGKACQGGVANIKADPETKKSAMLGFLASVSKANPVKLTARVSHPISMHGNLLRTWSCVKDHMF